MERFLYKCYESQLNVWKKWNQSQSDFPVAAWQLYCCYFRLYCWLRKSRQLTLIRVAHLGQQLMDLKSAHKSGAIAPDEHEPQRRKLLVDEKQSV